ncbi:MAG: hypothetical protein R2762_10775 [Bryobacteraceae bacterium]
MILNQELGFDEVRWATMRKISYDARRSFRGAPVKQVLHPGTRLFRLIPIANGRHFDGRWWMPEAAFQAVQDDAARAVHGGGALFRNYVAEYLALPSGGKQLCVVEVALTQPVYAWVGKTAPLGARPGGLEQVYLPNLAERGDPAWSLNARVVHTYWLKL